MIAADDTPPLVHLDGVSKSFGDKRVLREVGWTVSAGRITGLLGPNGAGKTTLFRLLMGLLKADRGCLEIDGLDAFGDRVELKRRIGFLPDEPIFYNYLKGREVIELSAAMHDLDYAVFWPRVSPLIERLDMGTHLDTYAEEYSRGMKKKLGLILALLHEPSLLILDEPTNGLDVTSTRTFFDLMRELAGDGVTVLFSTHLMDQVERLCDSAAIIHRGELVRSGSLGTLCDGRSLEEAFCELTGS